MKITKTSRKRPFSVIEKGETFEHNGEAHMRLNWDHYINPNTGFTINAVNLERGELKHFDKNEFVKICDVIEAVKEKIDDIPTAYDLDNVIKALGKELKLAEMDKEQVMIENPLQFDYVRGYAMGISNALEIVKGGAE